APDGGTDRLYPARGEVRGPRRPGGPDRPRCREGAGVADMTKHGAILTGLFLVLSPPSRAQTQDDAWTPKPDLLEELDSQAVQLRLKGANAPLDTYERYYRGTKRQGRLFIEGYFG